MPYLVYFKSNTLEEQSIEVEHEGDTLHPRVLRFIADNLGYIPFIPGSNWDNKKNVPTVESLLTNWADEEGVIVTRVIFATPT